MDFDEAFETRVAKWKFLINGVTKKKPLLDESDDDKEEEIDIIVIGTWISHVTLIRAWFSRIFSHYLKDVTQDELLQSYTGE